MKNIKERIVRNIRITPNGCWEWQGTPRKNGYCRTTYTRNGQRESWYLHRLSYFAFKNNEQDLPPNFDVCHLCDNRRCCNPEHLFLGTRLDNMHDAKNKGRVARGKKLPHTKLTEKDIQEIVELASKGVLYKEIAKKFNVCKQYVGRIALNNKIRRHEWHSQ